MNVKLEICAGSIHDFENLKDLRVDRFELNSAVELGGLTPDLNTLKAARLITDKPIIAMLRCRVGNFIYSQKELSIMYAMAQKLLENGEYMMRMAYEVSAFTLEADDAPENFHAPLYVPAGEPAVAEDVISDVNQSERLPVADA